MTKPRSQPPAMSFPDGLFLTFLALKIAHAVGWSWWLIFTPLAVGLVTLSIGTIREKQTR